MSRKEAISRIGTSVHSADTGFDISCVFRLEKCGRTISKEVWSGEGGRGQKGGVGILSQATRDILLILYFTFFEWGGVDFEVYYHII